MSTTKPLPSLAASVCLLFATLLMLSPVGVTAHELRPTVADITATPDTIGVSMRVNLEALITEIGPEHEDSDDAPQAERYNRLRKMSPDALQIEFRYYLSELLAQTHLNDNTGTALPLALKSLSIPTIVDARLPRDSTLVLESVREPPQYRWYGNGIQSTARSSFAPMLLRHPTNKASTKASASMYNRATAVIR